MSTPSGDVPPRGFYEILQAAIKRYQEIDRNAENMPLHLERVCQDLVGELFGGDKSPLSKIDLERILRQAVPYLLKRCSVEEIAQKLLGTAIVLAVKESMTPEEVHRILMGKYDRQPGGRSDQIG